MNLFLTITDTITSQNIDVPSWLTLRNVNTIADFLL